MSKNVSIHQNRFFHWIALSVALSFPWIAQADIPDYDGPCVDLTEIRSGERLDGYLGHDEDSRCFGLVIPSAGEITVYVNSGTRATFLQRFGTAEATDASWLPPVTIREEGISGFRLWVPGATRIPMAIAPQDSHVPVEEFTLITGFAPTQAPSWETGVTPGDVTKDLEQGEREDPGEIEIEPLDGPGGRKGWSQLDPSTVDALCRAAKQDDHGDTPHCATRLSDYPAAEKGEIASSTENDEDVFAFEVTAPQRVEVHMDTDMDLGLQLENSAGQRLALSHGDYGSPHRLAVALLPGRHFVRVVGHHGAEGDYVLRIESPGDAQ